MNIKLILGITLLSAMNVFAQQENDTIKKTKLRINGGFESSSQWYLNDREREITHPEDPFRSNNYLFVKANYGRFTLGTQVESYEKQALLNYNPAFEGTDFSLYYVNYKYKTLDITAGYFYEQFGSGLLLRAWEDRALGINTALRGGKVNFKPVDGVSVTALYGKQKSGFHVSDANILGVNTDLDISNLINHENFGLTAGFSYVMRSQDIRESIVEPLFNKKTSAYSGRLGFSKGGFYVSSEYNFKEKEPVLERTNINYNFIKPGNAFLVNMGYSERGLGIDATLRRMENMVFLSDREPIIYAPEETSVNYNDRILNFTPALTKQHHSSLANIYVYQAQNKVFIDPDGIKKAGEIGGQIDVFYNFKKGSPLGGKYGTKVALNMSNWFNLDATYSSSTVNGFYVTDYDAKFLGGKEKYFSDYNIEISKKISKDFRGNFIYVNQYYNNQYIQGIAQKNVIKTNILFAEGIYTFSGGRALTMGVEHMWADNDRGNWASLLVEYNHNLNWSIFAMDMYNYGFDNDAVLIDKKSDLFKIHFYNAGITYRKNSSRVSLGYGRQRGGLVCAGGVCREVPASTGVSFTISTSF
ncbi:DUF6029 family protein [Flavobacterium sp. SM2513]|uniref:DUF6029 family protein n=1 Tax=Flavobacterium sp. SM2513 TaxID=3424766 RepID=UPI003D7FC09C